MSVLISETWYKHLYRKNLPNKIGSSKLNYSHFLKHAIPDHKVLHMNRHFRSFNINSGNKAFSKLFTMDEESI